MSDRHATKADLDAALTRLKRHVVLSMLRVLVGGVLVLRFVH
ncbi:hypothetical protein BC1002_0149 [Paraburkholderia atlantica]|uniref:Uncharacterized protein n=1 Tax=Paraburkholderia atlantica TaxID=2654982 RepID=D5WA35_PARAM|nr:hypothetical protein [Paraburkholderia atlantica]ADG14257.1 hypothetical protein BC1002_0149 [Paraburkholderia atlantica]